MRTFHALAYLLGEIALCGALVYLVYTFAGLCIVQNEFALGTGILMVLNGAAVCIYTSECKPD